MSVAREYLGQRAGDCRAVDGSAAHREIDQHTLHATTTPRKRVVFDYNPTTKEITTKFTLKNGSNYAFAFKVHSSFEDGYVAIPGVGVVAPEEAFEVTILLSDAKSVGRDVEKDKFTIELVAADSDQNSAENFSSDDKRVLFIGLSQAAKDRLAFLAEEQKRQLQVEEQRKRHRRLMTYVGSGVLLAVVAAIYSVDFCHLTPDNQIGGGGGHSFV